MSETVTEPTRPPDLLFGPTGERFEFQTSAKGGDGRFRFRWTLGAGKKGPPQHVHDGETETFRIVSGRLRIWIDGEPRELMPGDQVSVPPLTRHRFLNPGPEAAVVDVSLDGACMEDALVPLAHRLVGRSLRLRDLAALIVHDVDARGSRSSSVVVDAAMRGLARLFRLLGARPLPRRGAWPGDTTAA